MANAKKCDICGEYYERYNIVATDEKPNFIALCQETVNNRITIQAYDTCPDCMKKMNAFIKGGKSHGRN